MCIFNHVKIRYIGHPKQDVPNAAASHRFAPRYVISGFQDCGLSAAAVLSYPAMFPGSWPTQCATSRSGIRLSESLPSNAVLPPAVRRGFLYHEHAFQSSCLVKSRFITGTHLNRCSYDPNRNLISKKRNPQYMTFPSRPRFHTFLAVFVFSSER